MTDPDAIVVQVQAPEAEAEAAAVPGRPANGRAGGHRPQGRRGRRGAEGEGECRCGFRSSRWLPFCVLHSALLMKVVVGLGNPGQAVRRHPAQRRLRRDRSAWPQGPACRPVPAAVSRPASPSWSRAGDKVLLVKPETFMNLSGRCVRQVRGLLPAAEPADLLVVCDDINLPLGKLRFRAQGTHGGHNGLRDIQNHLGTTEYARLRIGVGRAAGGRRGRSRARPVPARRAAGDRGRDPQPAAAGACVRLGSTQGIEACMNRYNGPDSVRTDGRRPEA